jgi:hypothetical protein
LLAGACGEEEKMVVFNRSEVIRLLCNDSTKSWERKAVSIDGQPADISECDLFAHMTLTTQNDSLKYLVKSQTAYCNNNTELLDSGLWEVLEESIVSDAIDRIVFYSVEGDTIIKSIGEVTSIYFTTKENSGGSVIQESFETALAD